MAARADERTPPPSHDSAHDHVHEAVNAATHDFLAEAGHGGERRTRVVIVVTLLMMVAEIAGGFWSGSMALLADGWHMGSHASALGIALFAYSFARKHAGNPRFAFGTWKVWILGGYTSAVVLGVVALLVGWEAATRIVTPEPIQCGEAIAIAAAGLVVNFVCAMLLRDDPGDAQLRDLPEGAACAVHDHNRRAAYLHVLADAFTSVLAIVALLGVWKFGWKWLDPVVGIVGALFIARWSIGLLRDTSRILVDADVHADVRERVVAALHAAGVARVVDVHVWRVGPAALAVIASVDVEQPASAASLAQVVRTAVGARHVTIEVCFHGEVARPAAS
ncbi:MAG TPA: CDF family Co(II)/Ni(II) efflux transporter DmeF [Planctomycetota bacterium]|nr:CDF family Co(II)/Ni(II) efflux transporter DmeF [Planctomycetota bacterium]